MCGAGDGAEGLLPLSPNPHYKCYKKKMQAEYEE
jgi:hypothetical protein